MHPQVKILFVQLYQLIFLAVGTNDNRAKSEDGYAEPLVPFAEQTAAMRRVIRILKDRAPGARIILIGPTAGNEALQKKRAEAAERERSPLAGSGITRYRPAALGIFARRGIL